MATTREEFQLPSNHIVTILRNPESQPFVEISAGAVLDVNDLETLIRKLEPGRFAVATANN